MREANRQTKGERIDCEAFVLDTYTACIKMCAMETPHILFQLADGRKALWRTEEDTWPCRRGKRVHLQAFFYAVTGTLRRVRVAESK